MADKLYYDDAGSTFKEAFAEARKGGKKTFEWNGQKYTTEMKGEKKSEPSASQSFPVDANMESASTVMGRGRAGMEGSGTSPLEKYTDNKATTASRNKRSMDLAIERYKAGVPDYKKMAKGGKVKSASSRADGCAQRGKTRGKLV